MGTTIGPNVKVPFLDSRRTNYEFRDVLQIRMGPIMRARAKKLKEVLNVLIQVIWAELEQSTLHSRLGMEQQPCNVLFVAQ